MYGFYNPTTTYYATAMFVEHFSCQKRCCVSFYVLLLENNIRNLHNNQLLMFYYFMWQGVWWLFGRVNSMKSMGNT